MIGLEAEDYLNRSFDRLRMTKKKRKRIVAESAVAGEFVIDILALLKEW